MTRHYVDMDDWTIIDCPVCTEQFMVSKLLASALLYMEKVIYCPLGDPIYRKK